jgi:hypothetical protein
VMVVLLFRGSMVSGTASVESLFAMARIVRAAFQANNRNKPVPHGSHNFRRGINKLHQDFSGRSSCRAVHPEHVFLIYPTEMFHLLRLTQPALRILVLGRHRFQELVRSSGLEPPRAFTHQLLRLARLPIPPRPQTAILSAGHDLVRAVLWAR